MKYAMILIVALGVSGCAFDSPISEESTSAIAVCGGGLSAGVSGAIEAEYERLTGGVDANFERYVKAILDANGATQEKYDSYLACVLEIDERQRADRSVSQCLGNCDSSSAGCELVTESVFNSCLKDRLDGCLRDCRRRGISRDECMGRMCSWTDMARQSRDYYTSICERNEDYRDQVDACVAQDTSCRNACTVRATSKISLVPDLDDVISPPMLSLLYPAQRD